ncbi:sulfate permease family inorganic anion transporter [Skeletonema marinoi]|uniref:Sulfate permease family inorganic anion transporter n=1 Tax=Skeletonema marinoi TaxID=267567 RepID=A0AAD8XZ42_9STRA|nr:sulfate permease family inorganic anion transporter [Skeletonema marinoi]
MPRTKKKSDIDSSSSSSDDGEQELTEPKIRRKKAALLGNGHLCSQKKTVIIMVINEDSDNDNNEVSLEAIKKKTLGRNVKSIYDLESTAANLNDGNDQHSKMIMDVTSFADGKTAANHLRQDLTCPICHDRLYNPEEEEEEDEANTGTCPTCRHSLPPRQKGMPLFRVNTALKACLDALYGVEMNQRRMAEIERKHKAIKEKGRRGESDIRNRSEMNDEANAFHGHDEMRLFAYCCIKVVDVELCLIAMEEDEVESGGFPAIIIECSDDEALICVGSDRVHTCIQSRDPVVSGDDWTRWHVRFRIDVKKILDSARGEDRTQQMELVKLKFSHLDTSVVLELRLPIDDMNGDSADCNIDFGVAESNDKNHSSRFLLDDKDEEEEQCLTTTKMMGDLLVCDGGDMVEDVVNLTMSNASIENLSLRVREWICKACASTLGLKTGIEGHEWEAEEVEEKRKMISRHHEKTRAMHCMSNSSYGAISNDECKSPSDGLPLLLKKEGNDKSAAEEEERGYTFLHIVIYAIINVIIAVPGLIGYASVIFNHPSFQPHMAELAKLVIFSSFVHQLTFTLFSSLSFAIGTVQDAGLIFLSAMANTIANEIINDGGTIEEVISTTLVVLPLGTAALGLVLMLLGKFRLLDIVSYLPMPVIGGYLAFIGYFCLEAGVALLLYFCSVTLDEARDSGWIGEETPPVAPKELIHLVDFNLVHWSMIKKCMGTWVGMLFVVAFASCLDIAAVSIDMGKPLDTNKEMVTVGASNFMSGLLFGFTVGVFIMAAYLFVCISPINILSVAPLFFLGSTLIFIGYDLLWEWLVDIREKLFLMEYLVLLTTFIAIQIIGMDFGIIFGVVVAVIDHVASTTRISSLQRVMKRSRAVWSNDHWQLLQLHGYHPSNPKIVTLELSGPVFFGSSQKVMDEIMNEIGLSVSEDEVKKMSMASPHTSTHISGLRRNNSFPKNRRVQVKPKVMMPRYVVIDISEMHLLDASAATSCFGQLAKLCEKRGIFLFAAGVLPRVECMLRSHEVSLKFEEEVEWKQSILLNEDKQNGKLILFETLFEALEFSERLLIQSKSRHGHKNLMRSDVSQLNSHLIDSDSSHHKLTYIFTNILREELSEDEKSLIDGIGPYYEETTFRGGEPIFQKDTHPDAFYIVLKGAVAVPRDRKRSEKIASPKVLSSSNLMELSLSSSNLMAIGDDDTSDATVARFTSQSLETMKRDDWPLYVIVQNLLLQASLMDLANCTCHN